jgi:hypothetical protein
MVLLCRCMAGSVLSCRYISDSYRQSHYLVVVGSPLRTMVPATVRHRVGAPILELLARPLALLLGIPFLYKRRESRPPAVPVMPSAPCRIGVPMLCRSTASLLALIWYAMVGVGGKSA